MDNDNNTMDTFSCSPPSNERSGDSPARRRQHRSYQAIMNSRRLQKFCDMVSALMFEAILIIMNLIRDRLWIIVMLINYFCRFGMHPVIYHHLSM